MDTYETLDKARAAKGSVAQKIIKINHRDNGICYIGSKVPMAALVQALEHQPMPEIVSVIDDYDTRTDEQVTIDKIKIETEINASLKCERCGDHVSMRDYHQTENSRWGKVTAFYCKSCAALLGQIGCGEHTAMQDRQAEMVDNTPYTKGD